ncbi:hypothetical protein I2485_07025 [Nesterenkonia sp. E16_7]|uniref:hypothetical protein n=1 Tax=unclassified Nesterenkonia TaxID=2629769 RepID=UPI001A930CF2|nr:MULTISPECIES: hypothetical protein [unclassified Nesterenkonia]MBO0596959.1 hypothetical protein [Nesterenkonia sp. E16_10]MBO0598403.1 hypothetical protein [Nesterenkonia sp. E16_7]
MTTTTETREEAQYVAATIRSQVTPLVLMSLGAHRLGSYTHENGTHALVFLACVLPFKKNGDRSGAARNMRVMITLNVADTYDIRVEYQRQGKTITHYSANSVYADSLAGMMLRIDSDWDLEKSSEGHHGIPA